MAMTYPRSIGDDYNEYVDDEYGYQYHAWEVISASESARHEVIRIGPEARLTEFEDNAAALTDLERWALARRRLKMGNLEAYFNLLQPLLDGDHSHRALLYPEIFADAARRFAESDRLDEAHRTVERIGAIWPEFAEALALLHAQITLLAGDVEAAHEAFDKVIAERPDVDLMVEIAEDFLKAKAFDAARSWLDGADAYARSVGDSASLVDIELLREHLPADETSADPQSLKP